MEKDVKLGKIALWVFLFLIIVTVVLAFGDAGNKNSVSVSNDISDYSEGWLIEYGNYAKDNIELPARLPNKSDTIVMTKKLSGLNGDTQSIVFYSHHQAVTVYVENEVRYQFGTVTETYYGKTPGNAYNVINLYESDNGKTLKIVLEAVYARVSGDCPEILIGDTEDCVLELVQKDSLNIFVSTLLILMEIVMIIVHFLTNKYIKFDNGFLYLGMFLVSMGIWSLSETTIVLFAVKNLALVSFITFSSLHLSLVPMMLFWDEILNKKYTKVFGTGAILSLCIYSGSLFLYVFGIMDFYETLFTVHIMYLLSFVAMMVIALISRKAIKASGRGALLYGVGIVIVGACIDMVRYYAVGYVNSSEYTKLALLIYSCIPIDTLLHDVVDKVNLGRQVGNYHKIAYTDALTGIGNRAAFNREMDSISQSDYYKYAIVNLDVNDLKKTNDKYGHESGDYLIITAASAIMNTFEKYGNCYRTGGDEFVVILYKVDEKMYENLIAKMREYLDGVKLNDKVGIKIASGYADYMYDLDVDLYSTLKRADEKMYEYKRKMKEDTVQED